MRIKRILRNNGLALTMFLLFLLCLSGQSIAGYHANNREQQEHGQPRLSWRCYVATSDLWESVFENWESEFLEMCAYVLLTAHLFQIGSAESKSPGTHQKESSQAKAKSAAPRLARWSRATRRVYEHSLSLALGLFFLLCFLAHLLAGTNHFNQELRNHGQPPVTIWAYFGGSQFWFESFQNWQSEFLGVFAIVVLSIWLREKGSPESKDVSSSNRQTGE